MSNSNWYSANSWYSPLHGEEVPAEAKTQSVPKPVKKKNTAVRIVAALLLAAVLITVAWITVDTLRKAAGVPDSSSGSSGNSSSDSMPDNPEQYFKNFYKTVDTSKAVVNIERTQLPVDFDVKLSGKRGNELSLKELHSECSPSVVAIIATADGKSGYSWGSGIILSSDGLIITNTHVINSCDEASVLLSDNKQYPAKLVGFDTISDIAVLKIEASGLPTAVLGDSSELEVGDKVAAIGNPLGVAFRQTLTDGIVSAIERGMQYKGRVMTLIQTNTALNEGNSGGPLFNMYGQVIGITNMKMTSSYSNVEGIAFAIPSSTVQSIVAAILKDGEVRGRPAIGVTLGSIPAQAMTQYDFPAGLYISAVEEKSDALKKGVKVGDVLTAINGTPVTVTSDVAAILKDCSVGDILHMTIWRDGATIDFDITLVDSNDLQE